MRVAGGPSATGEASCAVTELPSRAATTAATDPLAIVRRSIRALFCSGLMELDLLRLEENLDAIGPQVGGDAAESIAQVVFSLLIIIGNAIDSPLFILIDP